MNDNDHNLRQQIRVLMGELLTVQLDPAGDDDVLSELHPTYDSLAVLDAVGAVEQALGVDIDLVEDDLRRTFASVSAITGLVAAKLADQAAFASLSWGDSR